jgi:CheY-like chemotaxis protein
MQPDLLFLDINMPIMNGKEFLIAVSHQYKVLPFPVIIVTSSIDPEDYKETQSYPFVVGFLEKPMRQEAIESILMSVPGFSFRLL